jgi:hypothetical protein
MTLKILGLTFDHRLTLNIPIKDAMISLRRDPTSFCTLLELNGGGQVCIAEDS